MVQPAGRGSQAKGPVCVGGGLGQREPPRETRAPSLLARPHRGPGLPWPTGPGWTRPGGSPAGSEIAQARRGFVNRSLCLYTKKNSSAGSVVKNPPANAGHIRDTGSIPGSGRTGGGNGNPLQYSCLKKSMDLGAWRDTAHGVTKRRTGLSDQHSHFQSAPGSVSHQVCCFGAAQPQCPSHPLQSPCGRCSWALSG